jgi:hypothetical protein
MPDTVIVSPALGGVDETNQSAVSWPAIIAGGFTAAALSLLLLALGAGIGLSVVSPWSDRGISSTTAATGAGIYLVLVAVMSSAVGGYIAGRLRARWIGTHTDEVYFRDTAHGFLAWAFATVISVAFLASAAATLAGGAAAGAGPGAAMAADRGALQDRLNGYSDRLLRPDFAMAKVAGANVDPFRVQPADRTEVYRLLSGNERSATAMSAADHAYLVQLVAARTGLAPADAEKRVTEISNDLKVSADKARRGAAHLALWLTAAMLFGALSASLAATEGGGLRDGTWKYRR